MGHPPSTPPHDAAAAPGVVLPSAEADVPELSLDEQDAHFTHTRVNVLPQLRSRVVRESRRETWFVVNETGDELATVPIELEPGRSIRRVHVNGEVAEFSAGQDLVLVRPRRPLRPG